MRIFFPSCFSFPLLPCITILYALSTLLVSLLGCTMTLDALDAALASSPFIPASAHISELVTATGKALFFSTVQNPYCLRCSGLPCSHSLHTDTIMWTHPCLFICYQSHPCRLLDCNEGTEMALKYEILLYVNFYTFSIFLSIDWFDFLEKYVPLLQTLSCEPFMIL